MKLSYVGRTGPVLGRCDGAVFLRDGDIYDEGRFFGMVPAAMDPSVNGKSSAVAGRPIYHQVFHPCECFEIIPNQEGFPWHLRGGTPYWRRCF